jgi:hypothetical protein
VSKRIKVKPLGYVVISLAMIFLFLTIVSIYSPRDVNKGFRYFVNNKIGSGCISYNQAIYSRRLKDMLPDYIAESSVSGISKCSNKRELLNKVREGELYRVRNGRGYEVEDLSFSYPFLTKRGKDLLKEVGKRFRKQLAGTRLRGSDFRLTSMTRTTEILLKLRKLNSNASVNSPHFYGNTFDISYVRFSSPKWFVTDCDKYFLKESLAQVIWQLRQENKCWATYEIKQGCFHVVAR